MAKKIIQAQMQQRRDTAAQWAAKNPVLLDGELGLVTDNPNSYKIGDGVTAWNDLPLRGFDGNIVQELGGSATAVMSQKAITELVAAKLAQLDQDVPKLVDNDTADLEIADSQGNILVEFADGHIRTKNFNSRTSGGQSSSSALAEKTWCSLGTSITWYNNNQGGRFEKGYQGWLMEKLPVGTLVNKGINGGTLLQLAGQLGNIVSADIYTIEHGVNDWGRNSAVGTIEDYINNTGASTFYGAYRIIIDAIYAKNSKAVIVLCTPRKSRGFNGYLPSSCNGELDGIKLKDYADAVMEVARYEGLPVCDWFNRCGVNDHNLPLYSIDDALHPNDLGYKQMAQLLIEQFNNIY